jgi:hypothetical protein
MTTPRLSIAPLWLLRSTPASALLLADFGRLDMRAWDPNPVLEISSFDDPTYRN